jgi:hypothetical protein
LKRGGAPLAFLAAVLAAGAAAARADVRGAGQLRHMSFAVNDAPPSAEEARRFAAGEVTMDELVAGWLAGEAHRGRIRRFFHDLFGTQDFGVISAEHVLLRKNALGIYKLPDKPDCGAAESSAVPAWWLEPGQTVKVCNNILSPVVEYGERGKPGYASCTDANRIAEPRCGCGPDLILCAPKESSADMAQDAYVEFAERGLHMYENGRSWLELLASDQFYGTRWEYYLLLWRGWMSPAGGAPVPADVERLRSLPLDRRGLTRYPESGPERAPVVNGINFMFQYNNFRSRVRILSERLLCQPINPALNTDGIQSFVNPDLKDADRSHGAKAGCSACHHALDNLGSTLLGWDNQGTFALAPPSQLGHAFGQTGTGPRFLMRSFVERGPGFRQCMARRAWETFSGLPWAELPPTDQRAFEAMAADGPRALLRGVLTSSALRRVR